MSIPWSGMLPERWEERRLGAVLVERKEKNSPVKTDFILSLSAQYGVTPYTERGTQGNKHKEDLSGYNIARNGDLLVNNMNVIIGSSGVSNWDGAISPVYYALYPRSNSANIRYLEYIFRLQPFYLSLMGMGSGILEHRMRIPMLKLNNITLPLPPRDEQDQIVQYLNWKVSGIDKLINAKRRQIELLREQKRKTIENAITNIHAETISCRYLGSLQNGISESGDFFTAGTPFVNYGDVYKNEILPISVSGTAKANVKHQKNYSVE